MKSTNVFKYKEVKFSNQFVNDRHYCVSYGLHIYPELHHQMFNVIIMYETAMIEK